MSGKKNRNKKQTAPAKAKKSSSLIPAIVGVLLALVIIALAFAAINSGKNNFGTTSSGENSETSQNEALGQALEFVSDNSTKEERSMKESVKVLVEMENGDEFTLALYPEYAPKTVENFVKLVENGFYDGVGFHRVVDGFMAQGGDPDGTGMGGSDETIPGEFASNGFADNTLSHTRGVISMARSQHPDSASSQFFICYDNANFLDGSYAAFGEVIDGMETVDEFLNVERSYNSMGELASPNTPIVMKKLTVIE